MKFDSSDSPMFINEQIHRNAQATTVLLASLCRDEYHKVSGLDNAKQIWDTLSDADINTNTSTSTPAAPSPAQAPSAPVQAPPLPPGPVTRARARELNYIMLLKNEGPEE